VLIMERFVGRDLGFVLSEMTLSQMTILAEQVVIFERAAASLPLGNGFGFVPEGAKGASSWFEVVQADRGRFSAPEGSPPEVIEVIEGARLALQASRDRLGTVKPVCFLDDLTTKNVIVHEGRLSGVVDFDVVCYGDPMYWLALTRVAVLSDVGSAGWFYVEELQRIWGPNERDLQNLNLYSALHAAAFITYDLADRDRLGRLIEAVHQWL